MTKEQLQNRILDLESDLREKESELREADTAAQVLGTRVEKLEMELDAVGGKARLCDLLLRALDLTEQDAELLTPKLECGAVRGTLQ